MTKTYNIFYLYVKFKCYKKINDQISLYDKKVIKYQVN